MLTFLVWLAYNPLNERGGGAFGAADLFKTNLSNLIELSLALRRAIALEGWFGDAERCVCYLTIEYRRKRNVGGFVCGLALS